MRGQGEAPQRADDGPGQKHREQYRDGDDDHHCGADQRPLAANRAREGAIVLRRQKDPAVHRDSGRDDRCEIGCVADVGHEPLALECSDRLRPRLQAINGRFRIILKRGRADDGVESAIERASDVFCPLLGVRIPQRICRSRHFPAIDHQPAVRSVEPKAVACRLRHGREKCGPFGLGHVCQRGGSHRSFDARLLRALLVEAIAEDIEIQCAERDQQERQDVERENPVAERPAPRPAQRQVGFVLSRRRSGIRRHRGSRSRRSRGRRPGTCGGCA